MLGLSFSFFWWFVSFFRSRHSLGLELVALRQRLGVLKRKNPRPRLGRWDRLFWVAFRRFWSRWAEALIVVKPDTVVSWHRARVSPLLALSFPPRPESAKNCLRTSAAHSAHGQ
jgi:hypothetical protein